MIARVKLFFLKYWWVALTVLSFWFGRRTVAKPEPQPVRRPLTDWKEEVARVEAAVVSKEIAEEVAAPVAPDPVLADPEAWKLR